MIELGKALTVWLDSSTVKKFERIKQYIKKNNIPLPMVAKIPELRNKVNKSMIIRFCVEQTLKQLERKDQGDNNVKKEE